jgi:chromosome segregation ATPase
VAGVVRVTGIFEREGSAATAPEPATAPKEPDADDGELAALRDRVHALEAQLARTIEESEIAAAAASDAAGSARVAELERERDELRDQFETLKRDHAEMRHHAASARGLAIRVSQLGEELAAAQAENERARDAVVAEGAKVAALEAQRLELEAALRSAQRELAAAQESATQSSESAQALVAHETEIAQLRQQAEQVPNLTEELAKVRAELEILRTGREHTAAEDARRIGEQRARIEELTRRETAANAENARLLARIQELESTAALAEKMRGEAAGRVEALVRERDGLRQQLSAVAAERDQLAQRAAAPTQSAAEIAAIETETRALQEKLAASEAALAAAQKQAKKLDEELGGMRLVLARANQTADESDALRASLERAEAELTDLRAKHELLKSQHELLAFRAQGTAEALAESQSALTAAEATIAEQQARVVAAEEQIQSLQAQQADASAARSTVEIQARLLTEREAELENLRAELADAQHAQSELAARVAGLETAPRTATPGNGSPTDPDDVRRQREELQVELIRLQRRVTELESERNASGNTQAVLENQLQQARQLRDDTLARFQEVVAQLNAMRDERDRLARANVSLQAELRATRGADAKAVASAGDKTGPSYLERLLGAVDETAIEENSGSSGGAPAPRPARGQPRGNPAAEKFIAALQVIGITQSPEGDKVILNGRLFRAGDIIDEQLSLAFERVDGDALLFTDALGHEYRRRF